jgi:hypothetical protein
MSQDDEPKDPVLEKLRAARGSYTDVAREIAKGVVEYDRAKKRAPDGGAVHDPALFKDVSDAPVRNAELGIPFRTAPGSPAEAAAQGAQRSAEDLGILPEPKPFTVPPREPLRASREAETVPVSRDPVVAQEPRRRAWVFLLAALVTGLGLIAVVRLTQKGETQADAGATATTASANASVVSAATGSSAPIVAPSAPPSAVMAAPSASAMAPSAPSAPPSAAVASPVKSAAHPVAAPSVAAHVPTAPEPPTAGTVPPSKPAAPAASASSRFGQFIEEEKQK